MHASLNDLKEIANNYSLFYVTPFIERFEDELGNVTFGFIGSPIRFTFTKAAVDYINYRTNSQFTISDLVENRWIDEEKPHTYTPIGELNAKLAATYGEQATASFRDGHLISLLNTDYVIYTHSEVVDAIEAAGDRKLAAVALSIALYRADHEGALSALRQSRVELDYALGKLATAD